MPENPQFPPLIVYPRPANPPSPQVPLPPPWDKETK